MKKSKIKFVIRKSMGEYYKNGLTTTAWKVRTEIFKSIDRLFAKKHKK